jgi:low affinity Fe/Cu permease
MSENEKRPETSPEASYMLGTPYAFAVACAIVLRLGLTGPCSAILILGSSSSTRVRPSLPFLIQHTQNRDSRALQLKLDELLRSLDVARNKLINLENCSVTVASSSRQVCCWGKIGLRRNWTSSTRPATYFVYEFTA